MASMLHITRLMGGILLKEALKSSIFLSMLCRCANVLRVGTVVSRDRGWALSAFWLLVKPSLLLKSLYFLKLMVLLVFALALVLGRGEEAVAESQDYGQKSGYLFDVEEEKYVRIEEMVVIEKPQKKGRPLKNIIFDKKLTKEFKRRYERQFGDTEADQNIELDVHRNSAEDGPRGSRVTAEEGGQQERQFGEYMMKRLTEHHLDKYMRTNPRARKIYELKKRLSNVSVKVKKGYKFSFRYSYTGNDLTLRLKNPYDIINRVVLQMDPSQFGPSQVQETHIYLRYALNKKLQLGTHYLMRSQSIHLLGYQRLTSNLRSSLTLSSLKPSKLTDPVDSSALDSTFSSQNEKRILLGLVWSL